MKTNVYIDGFNFYYGCVRHTKYKWIDFSRLCKFLLPDDEIYKIRYFTAMVIGDENDPEQPQRQRTFLRALKTIPNLKIHSDKFQIREIKRPFVTPENHSEKWALVKDIKEKGTDVSLASFMLMDGFKGEYEKAVLISNDSDYKTPVKMVKDNLKLEMVVFNPDRKREICYALRSVASSYEFIYPSPLHKCQFPPVMKDKKGDIRKPDKW